MESKVSLKYMVLLQGSQKRNPRERESTSENVSCAQSHSCVRLFEIPWTVACQAPLSMGTSQATILEWVDMPSSKGSSQSRDQTQVSRIVGGFFTI